MLQNNRSRIVWSIAGFDPGSGAGMTADLMTFAAHGLFGCSAITALTVQTTVGVFGIEPVAPTLLAETLSRLGNDLPPLGIKVGMLATHEAAAVIVAEIGRLSRQEPRLKVVLDPVLRSSSGRILFPEEGLPFLRDQLLPLVDWITPNWAELGILADMPVNSPESALQAARLLQVPHPKLHVVATGGDQGEPVDLLIQPSGKFTRFDGRRVETSATHGTGCAFSSSLLSHLVLGGHPEDSVRAAKAYVEGALQRAAVLGQGRGPMELLWPLLR